MLVWRKGNIKKTVSVLQYCVLLQWCIKVRAVLTGRSTISGFDRACFSTLSSERLCIFYLHDAIYILIFLVISFSLPFSELNLVGLALDVVD